MRRRSFTRSIFSRSIFGILGTFVLVNAANAETIRSIGRVVRAPMHGEPTGARRNSQLRPRRNTSNAPGCNANYGTSGQFFLGVSDDNFAGGDDSAVLGGGLDEACDNLTAIGGGDLNIIGGTAPLGAVDAFIGGGVQNQITAEDAFIGAGADGSAEGGGSFIGAGGEEFNQVYMGAYGSLPDRGVGSYASGMDSFVGAGDLNSASGNGSFVGGGDYTYAASGAQTSGNQAAGVDSFVGAGDQNVDASTATDGVIDGGNNNYVSGVYATVAGGSGNKAEGAFAFIPGGADNEALGAVSFAGGYHAEAAHNGSFVWSDDVSGSGFAKDGNANEFVVRASGGTYFFSNEGESVGVKLAAGSGTWSSLSDRNAKTDIVPLDDASILAKVAALPIDAWQYKTERGVRHLGPMAQDFYAAFGAGEDSRHITSLDEDGVALAAIKALHAENASLRYRLDQEDAGRASDHARLTALEKLVASIETRKGAR